MNFKLLFVIFNCLFVIPVISSDVTTVFAHGAYAHPGQAKRFKPAFANPNNVAVLGQSLRCSSYRKSSIVSNFSNSHFVATSTMGVLKIVLSIFRKIHFGPLFPTMPSKTAQPRCD